MGRTEELGGDMGVGTTVVTAGINSKWPIISVEAQKLGAVKHPFRALGGRLAVVMVGVPDSSCLPTSTCDRAGRWTGREG